MGHRDDLEAALRGGKIAKRRVIARLASVKPASMPKKIKPDEKRVRATSVLGFLVFISTLPLLILWFILTVRFWNDRLGKVYGELCRSVAVVVGLVSAGLVACAYFSLVPWLVPILAVAMIPIWVLGLSTYLLISKHAFLRHPFVYFRKPD